MLITKKSWWKAAKRWDAVIMQIVQLLVAGGFGFLISRIFN